MHSVVGSESEIPVDWYGIMYYYGFYDVVTCVMIYHSGCQIWVLELRIKVSYLQEAMVPRRGGWEVGRGVSVRVRERVCVW